MKAPCLILLMVAALLTSSCHRNYAEDYEGNYRLHYEIAVEELGAVVYTSDDTLTVTAQGKEGELIAECSAFKLTGWADSEGLHFYPYNVHTEQTDAIIETAYEGADVDIQGVDYTWTTPVSFELTFNMGLVLNYTGTQTHTAVRF